MQPYCCALIMTCALFAGLFSPQVAHAAEANKCIAKDGKVTYQNSPCPGAYRIPAEQLSKLKNLSIRQADVAFDCIEAVDNVVNREPDALLLATSRQKYIIAGFERHCTAMGFKTPLEASTRDFNMAYSKAAREILRDTGYDGPSYTRTYSGGDRNPPLFSVR